MTWAKVFLVEAVVEWGYNIVVSDLDVVWFRDPMGLFARYPQAGRLSGVEWGGVWSHLDVVWFRDPTDLFARYPTAGRLSWVW